MILENIFTTQFSDTVLEVWGSSRPLSDPTVLTYFSQTKRNGVVYEIRQLGFIIILFR